MFILGMDIGYSNLKIAFGDSDREIPETKVLPVGAGPKECLGIDFLRKKNEGIQVQVDGQAFVAGVEPSRLEGWNRELHEDYPATASYKALFYASLLLSGQDKIDCLVTGLPVSQYLDDKMRDRLKSTMAGVHQVTKAREIEVGEVLVIGQPIGAFVNAMMENGEESNLVDARALVFDAGFFSVDWVLIDEQEILEQSSGTSTYATSVILDEASALIADDFGGSPSREKIEKAIRNGKWAVTVFGKEVNLINYLEKAAKKVAGPVMANLRESLRNQKDAVDFIILAGGGSFLYEQALKEVFPMARMISSRNSVLANACGYWHFGGLE